MASLIKLYTPTTPARRKTSVVDYKNVLTVSKPFRKLVVRKKRNAGRNNSGKITIRHRGGGAKKMLRLIDFKKTFEEGYKVLTVEYDPNRSSFICLVVDIKLGTKHYILYTKGLEAGKQYGNKKDTEDGVKDKIKNFPVGSYVNQIELQPNQGAKLVRSAGNYAKVTAREEMYVTVKLPSGEIRRILGECLAVLGRIGKEYHELVRLGKAGRVRHKGFRPTVRGKVMNPVDHPHGGGEARNPIGLKYPKTPWGKHATGVKTRNKKKLSSKFIVKRRVKK